MLRRSLTLSPLWATLTGCSASSTPGRSRTFTPIGTGPSDRRVYQFRHRRMGHFRIRRDPACRWPTCRAVRSKPARDIRWIWSDSNRHPSACKAAALPLELQTLGWGGESNPLLRITPVAADAPLPQRCQTRDRTWNLRLNRPLHYPLCYLALAREVGVEPTSSGTKTLRLSIRPLPNEGGEASFWGGKAGRLRSHQWQSPVHLYLRASPLRTASGIRTRIGQLERLVTCPVSPWLQGQVAQRSRPPARDTSRG